MSWPSSCIIANNFLTRLRGLIGSNNKAPLLIPNCKAIHTFFMRESIDLYWLDEDFRVLAIEHEIRPYRFSSNSNACHVLECFEATQLPVKLGDKLPFQKKDSKNIYVCDSGQALVEMAFVLPLLLTIVFGFVQLGLAIHELQKLTHTSNYAVQVGSLTNDNLKVTGSVDEFYTTSEISVAIESQDFTDQSVISDADRRYGDIIKVQLSKPFQLQIPFITVEVIDLKSEASARILCRNNNFPHTCL